MKDRTTKRQDHEFPEAIEKWGWKYHHIGIPVTHKMPGERYLPALGFHVSGFDTSPFGIEWMRFEDHCTLDKLIQQVPHVAFVVENLDDELAKRPFRIISEPGAPSDGVRVAMIEYQGIPVELMEFSRNTTG